MLDEEAPAFLRALLELNLPAATGRLRIPVVETAQKSELAAENSPVAEFFAERCSHDAQVGTARTVVYDRYKSWCGLNELAPLGKFEFGRQLKPLRGNKYPVVKVELDGKRVDGYAGLKVADELSLAA